MTPAQLKSVREGLKWDLTETSERTGYSRQHLHNVEKGRYNITKELIDAFSKAVQRSIVSQQKILLKLKNSA